MEPYMSAIRMNLVSEYYNTNKKHMLGSPLNMIATNSYGSKPTKQGNLLFKGSAN